MHSPSFLSQHGHGLPRLPGRRSRVAFLPAPVIFRHSKTGLLGPRRRTPRLLFFALLLALAAPAPSARAQLSDAVRHFDEGNRLYAQGDYSGALTAYDRAVAAGHVSGALFYNMGNAYYRLDEIGQAVRYYEKARRLIPRSEQLSHNLAMTRERTVDSFSALPEPFWRPAWRSVVRRVGPGGLFFVGLFLYLVAAALAGHRIWTGTRSDWRRRGFTLSAAGAVVLVLLALAASVDSERNREAVIVARQVALLEAPEVGARADIDIHEGLVVRVTGQREEFVEVRLPNGTAGWVHAGAVAPI